MSDKIYWKGIEEKEQLEGFRQIADKEFAEELPLLSSITETVTTLYLAKTFGFRPVAIVIRDQ